MPYPAKKLLTYLYIYCLKQGETLKEKRIKISLERPLKPESHLYVQRLQSVNRDRSTHIALYQGPFRSANEACQLQQCLQVAVGQDPSRAPGSGKKYHRRWHTPESFASRRPPAREKSLSEVVFLGCPQFTCLLSTNRVFTIENYFYGASFSLRNGP